MGLRNASIGKKLFILISLSVLIFFAIGGTGFYYMQKMKENSDQVYQEGLLPIKWQSQIRTNNRAVDGYTLEMLLTTDSAEQAELGALIEERISETQELVAKLEEILLSDAERKRWLSSMKVIRTI